MYLQILATDYDGTLARDGVVASKTMQSLQELKNSGRKVILVTGRELPDLQRVCPDLSIFDLVVAENGALVYSPATKEERLVAPAPSQALVALLKSKGVVPLSVGKTIIATWKPNEALVLQAIQELG